MNRKELAANDDKRDGHVERPSSLVPAANADLISASEMPSLLQQIRPAWQAKDLISRVRKLLPVDPSSACQRIFNAALHDLRDKVTIAGVDIAKEAAKQHKLPPVERSEDIDEYPPAKLIDLSYRMGLLSRPEWRRISRVYEIRRDLEHEDDEYEADVADCVYIFKAAVEIVLARDPIQLLRVVDVKEVVEQPHPAIAGHQLLEDFEHAPQPRQEEICRFLISVALDGGKPELVRQNAFTIITSLEPRTLNPVKLLMAKHLQDRVGRTGMDFLHARVAFASGTLAYLKQSLRADFFEAFYREMERVGHHWRAHDKHGELLRNLGEVGGLMYIPSSVRKKYVEWLCLIYIGLPGGYGYYGHGRNVFYSDSGAPLAEEMLRDAAALVKEDVKDVAKMLHRRHVLDDEHVARRFQELLSGMEC